MSRYLLVFVVGIWTGCVGSLIVTLKNGGVADRALMDKYQKCVARESDHQARVEAALDLGRVAERVVLKQDGKL